LSEERARFAADARIETAGELQRFAAKGHVDAERHLLAELDRIGPVVEQCDHAPVVTAAIRQPGWARRAPNRQDFSADVSTAVPRQRLTGAIEPVGRNPHVIVGRHDDLAGREGNARVQRGAAPGGAFERIAERRREAGGPLAHDGSRLVSGVVVHHDDFPRIHRRQRGQALERATQISGPVVGRNDDRGLHRVAHHVDRARLSSSNW
jgi:hypothetical protein